MDNQGKTILITGSTDGIGLEAAKMLVSEGHSVLLHGRSQDKLDKVYESLGKVHGGGAVEKYIADLSIFADIEALARAVSKRHSKLDVLINNAGVLKVVDSITETGLDMRFAVNTIAPFLLTKKLLPLIGTTGRVVNVSSRAQSPVNLNALTGQIQLSEDLGAYAQSKLAITMWTVNLAAQLKGAGPVIVAVNPGSLLGSKMVKEGFGVEGKDIAIGGEILCRAALSDEFASASGKYYDNDAGRFSSPHPDAHDPKKVAGVVHAIEDLLPGS